jgi:4-hydroxy-tetrahydrodipicolinate synthase
MNKFKPWGIIVPIITPFKNNEQQDLDEEALRKLVRFMLENRVHGVFPCGGTGEYPLLSEEEHKRVVEIVIDEVRGKVPVLPGAHSPGTRNALNLAKHAKQMGGAAIVVQTPWWYGYNLITDEGLLDHYRTIAKAADIPIVLYNEPPVCGYDVKPQLLAELANANVVGTKEASHMMSHTSEVIRACGDKMVVISADGAQLLPHLILGARANITAANNVAPGLFVELFESFMKGEMEKARQLNEAMVPLYSLCGPPPNVKAAVNMLGIDVGPPRKPLRPASEETKAKLKAILKDLRLL